MMRLKSLAVTLFIATVFGSSSAFAGDASWQPVFEEIVAGGMVHTGNALGLSKATGENSPGDRGSIGAFSTLDDSSRVGQFPFGTTLDWRDNGSQAPLTLPINSDVVHAELVWAGSSRSIDEDVRDELDSPVTFHTPLREITVEARADEAATVDTDVGVSFYSRSADVTQWVRDAGSGFYGTSGVPATVGPMEDDYNAAGWALMVLYEREGDREVQVSLWSGGQFVDSETGLPATVSLPPRCLPEGIDRPDNASLSFGALEGDADLSDIEVWAGPDGESLSRLSGSFNPGRNFFAAQINDRSGAPITSGTFANRRHLPGNPINGGRQGLDLTTVDATAHFGSADEALGLEVRTERDAIFLFMKAAVTEVSGASIDRTLEPFADQESVEVGDIVTLTFPLDFLYGGAGLKDVIFTPELTSGLDFIPGTFAVRGEPTAVDDLFDGVFIGSVEPGQSLSVSFDVEVTDLPPNIQTGYHRVRGNWTWMLERCEGVPDVARSWRSAPLDLNTPFLRADVLRIGDGAVESGDMISLRMRLRNASALNVADNEARLTVPDGLEYVSGSTRLNGETFADANGQRPWSAFEAAGSPVPSTGLLESGVDMIVRQDFLVLAQVGEPVEVLWEAWPGGGPPFELLSDSLLLEIVDCDVTPENCEPPEESSTDEESREPPSRPDGTVCGNGVIEGDQECDDGNLAPGDGCSPECTVEDGWECEGEPSVCTPLCPDPPCEDEEETTGREPGDETEESPVESTSSTDEHATGTTEDTATSDPAATDTDAPTTGTEPPMGDDGGCSCATGPGRGSSSAMLLSVLLGFLLVRRRNLQTTRA